MRFDSDINQYQLNDICLKYHNNAYRNSEKTAAVPNLLFFDKDCGEFRREWTEGVC
jgi:hypothetical protein